MYAVPALNLGLEPGLALAVERLDLSRLKNYRNRWSREEGAHAVINNANGAGMPMDISLYQMMAVQMIIGDPAAFEPQFELVSDRFPAARIYRVR